eukprot:2151451-Ditylum_brightwellii.AAC.1
MHLILSINNMEPRNAENAIHLLRSSQHKKENFTINMYLAKRGLAPTKTQLDEDRHIFKRVEFHPTKVLTSKTTAFFPITPQDHKVTFAPNGPTAPKHMRDLVKSKHKSEWKESMFENYEKMNTSGTFSAPFLRHDLPSTTKILKAQPAFKTKL